MRISDWSSDVCSSDLVRERPRRRRTCVAGRSGSAIDADPLPGAGRAAGSGEGGMTQADLATPLRIERIGRDDMSLRALATLRMTVFRGWPYLYDGSLDYEAEIGRAHV